jgi:hypothetical protein
MTKAITTLILSILITALCYYAIFKIAVVYVWPEVRQQMIEILQEGRK